MIGVDTNVLVRYLTRDDAEQYQRAKTFLEETCTEDRPGYLNVVVLCELVWVLQGAYGATKGEVIRVLEQILMTRQLEVAHRDAVRAALQAYAHHSADFADGLIGALNRMAPCQETVTFDQQAARLGGFRAL